MTVRYLEKAESADGSITVTWPTSLLEWEPSQGLRIPVAAVPGGSYEFDLQGTGPAMRANARETVRFAVKHGTDPTEIDEDIEELCWKLYLAGRLKLFTVDANGDRRWCWARLVEMPSMRISNPYIVPVSLSFMRFSDWYATTAYEETFVIDASPKTITVENPGLMGAFAAVLILRGTFTNPVITNNANGYVFETARDGSNSAHYLKVDAGRHTIEWSTNSGGLYADDWANYQRPSGQVQLMVFEAGENELQLTGANGAELDVSFYPGYPR